MVYDTRLTYAAAYVYDGARAQLGPRIVCIVDSIVYTQHHAEKILPTIPLFLRPRYADRRRRAAQHCFTSCRA